MKYKHIIFDLDGTLIDTETAVLKTWQCTLKQYGYTYTLDQIRIVLGVTTDIGIQRLKVEVDKDYAFKLQHNYQKYASQTKFFEGCEELLKELKDQVYYL